MATQWFCAPLFLNEICFTQLLTLWFNGGLAGFSSLLFSILWVWKKILPHFLERFTYTHRIKKGNGNSGPKWSNSDILN